MQWRAHAPTWNQSIQTIDIILKLRTEGRRSRVRELGSIQLFNVTSANVVHFFTKFCTHNHTGIWNKGSEFSNDMIYIYDFIKHDTLLSSDFTCISGAGYYAS